jgi:hypothetical protein
MILVIQSPQCEGLAFVRILLVANAHPLQVDPGIGFLAPCDAFYQGREDAQGKAAMSSASPRSTGRNEGGPFPENSGVAMDPNEIALRQKLIENKNRNMSSYIAVSGIRRRGGRVPSIPGQLSLTAQSLRTTS